MSNYSKPKESAAKKLKKLQADITYYQRQYRRMRIVERKQDTRRKIQLGGLVKKAGLDEESTAVILGLLLEAAEKLQQPESNELRSEWKIKGDLALSRAK